jgi:hypothetical protein
MIIIVFITKSFRDLQPGPIDQTDLFNPNSYDELDRRVKFGLTLDDVVIVESHA